jgi:hypothetical protein
LKWLEDGERKIECSAGRARGVELKDDEGKLIIEFGRRRKENSGKLLILWNYTTNFLALLSASISFKGAEKNEVEVGERKENKKSGRNK